VVEEEGYSWFFIATVVLALLFVGALAAAAVRKLRQRKAAGKKGGKYKNGHGSPSSPTPASKEAWKGESPKKQGKTYRKKAAASLEPEPTTPPPESGGGWMGKFWKSKASASPEPATVQSFEAADPAELVPGAEVRLFGLSKIEYNGLKGIVRGPAEKEGRFVIDVILFDSATVQETQELSLKADNLRIIPQTARSP
jgi:hypothetical protein